MILINALITINNIERKTSCIKFYRDESKYQIRCLILPKFSLRYIYKGERSCMYVCYNLKRKIIITILWALSKTLGRNQITST